MQEEVVSLKQQKLIAEEKMLDERARADHLDKQKQTFSSNIEALLNNEVRLALRTESCCLKHILHTENPSKRIRQSTYISESALSGPA